MNTNAASTQQEEMPQGLETVIVTRVREIVEDWKDSTEDQSRCLPSESATAILVPFVANHRCEGPALAQAGRR